MAQDTSAPWPFELCASHKHISAGNPKDKSWQAAQKLMGNVDKFLERLKDFKGVIDAGQVQKKTVEVGVGRTCMRVGWCGDSNCEGERGMQLTAHLHTAHRHSPWTTITTTHAGHAPIPRAGALQPRHHLEQVARGRRPVRVGHQHCAIL